MPTNRPELEISVHSIVQVPSALMIAAHAGGMPYERSETVQGDLPDLWAVIPADAQLLCSQRTGRAVVADVEGARLKIECKYGKTDIRVVGVDELTVDSIIEQVAASAREVIPPPPPSKVRMSMWWCGSEPTSIIKGIDAGSWTDIQSGYPPTTRRPLDPLMAMPGTGENDGRLILWHGDPGTGKTTAVRALARQWSSWCDVHYVTDPERLFAVPGYLLTVAGDFRHQEDNDRWRLVVAEDCDEYLRADAKHRAGASLGRLLNLSDGILGNGLRVIVLLTTNEDVGRLHPAITRAGRCLSQVRFDRFNRDQASAWLGVGFEPSSDGMTLAEMYALRADRSRHELEPVESVAGGYL